MWDLNSKDLPPAFWEENLRALEGFYLGDFVFSDLAEKALVQGFLNLASSLRALVIQIPTRPSQSLTNGGTQASVIFLKWFLNGQPGLGATGMPFVPVSMQSQPQPAMTEVCVCDFENS